jgi:para-nitrobenzyl esterase
MKIIPLLSSLALALACAAQPRSDAPPAAPSGGALSSAQVDSGALAGVPGNAAAISVFRGVPFAAPPVGERRWRAPEPAAAWTGTRRAAEFSKSCVQKVQRRLLPWTEEYMPQREMSEDCLALNVWTGAPSAAERRPVLVYIHGGGYSGGAGDVLVYDGEALAARGVVVVTFNYRVGVFGFFAHPGLTAEGGHEASGNYGLLDQIAALRWVQRNIAAFGGDPQNVTVAGQSAGAGSVHLLTASPLARGLFQRAIAQSGAWDQRQKLPERAEAEKRGLELAHGRSLAELRALPAEALRDEALASGAPYRPIVDGWVVPDQVPSIYERGQQIDVPLLTGLTADEESSQAWYGTLDARGFSELVEKRFPGRGQEIAARYTTEGTLLHERQKQLSRDQGLARLHAWRATRSRTGKSPDYGYYFERAIPWPAEPKYQAFHSAELPYVFDNLSKLDRPWEDVDRQLSRTMASYWVNFIRSGNPNGDGLPEWPSDRERVMRLGAQVRAEVLPEAEALRLMAAAPPG